MALVSENSIDRWFDPEENSWVYRGFCFLFHNPLWKIRTPKGYSLCPYFWLSVFSWLVFRPFVYLIAKPCITLVKVLFFVFGKPIVEFDSFINKKFFRDRLVTGLSLAMSILFATLISIFLFLLKMAIAEWMGIENGYFKYAIAYFCVNVLSLVVGTGYTEAGTIHNYNNVKLLNDDNKCKPLYYSFVLSIVSTIALALAFPSEVSECFVDFGRGIMFALAGIWLVICAIGNGIVWLLGKLAWSIAVLAKVLVGFLFATIAGLAFFVWFILVALFLSGVMKIVDVCEKITIAKKREDHSVSASDWEFVIYKYLKEDKNILYYLETHVDYYAHINNLYEGKAYTKRLAERVLDKMADRAVWGGNIAVPSSLIGISRLDFDSCKKFIEMRNLGLINEKIGEVVVGYLDKAGSYMYEENIIKEVINQIVDFDKVIAEKNEKSAKRSDRALKRHEKCVKVTGAIEKLFAPIFKLFSMIFVSPVRFVAKKLWFVLKEFGRLCVYLWIVAKAAKQGACPYRRFGLSTAKIEAKAAEEAAAEEAAAKAAKAAKAAEEAAKN